MKEFFPATCRRSSVVFLLLLVAAVLLVFTSAEAAATTNGWNNDDAKTDTTNDRRVVSNNRQQQLVNNNNNNQQQGWQQHSPTKQQQQQAIDAVNHHRHRRPAVPKKTRAAMFEQRKKQRRGALLASRGGAADAYATATQQTNLRGLQKNNNDKNNKDKDKDDDDDDDDFTDEPTIFPTTLEPTVLLESNVPSISPEPTIDVSSSFTTDVPTVSTTTTTDLPTETTTTPPSLIPTITIEPTAMTTTDEPTAVGIPPSSPTVAPTQPTSIPTDAVPVVPASSSIPLPTTTAPQQPTMAPTTTPQPPISTTTTAKPTTIFDDVVSSNNGTTSTTLTPTFNNNINTTNVELRPFDVTVNAILDDDDLPDNDGTTTINDILHVYRDEVRKTLQFYMANKFNDVYDNLLFIQLKTIPTASTTPPPGGRRRRSLTQQVVKPIFSYNGQAVFLTGGGGGGDDTTVVPDRSQVLDLQKDILSDTVKIQQALAENDVLAEKVTISKIVLRKDDDTTTNDIQDKDGKIDDGGADRTPVIWGTVGAGIAVLALFLLFYLYRQHRRKSSRSHPPPVISTTSSLSPIKAISSPATNTTVPFSPYGREGDDDDRGDPKGETIVHDLEHFEQGGALTKEAPAAYLQLTPSGSTMDTSVIATPVDVPDDENKSDALHNNSMPQKSSEENEDEARHRELMVNGFSAQIRSVAKVILKKDDDMQSPQQQQQVAEGEVLTDGKSSRILSISKSQGLEENDNVATMNRGGPIVQQSSDVSDDDDDDSMDGYSLPSGVAGYAVGMRSSSKKSKKQQAVPTWALTKTTPTGQQTEEYSSDNESQFSYENVGTTPATDTLLEPVLSNLSDDSRVQATAEDELMLLSPRNVVSDSSSLQQPQQTSHSYDPSPDVRNKSVLSSGKRVSATRTTFEPEDYSFVSDEGRRVITPASLQRSRITKGYDPGDDDSQPSDEEMMDESMTQELSGFAEELEEIKRNISLTNRGNKPSPSTANIRR